MPYCSQCLTFECTGVIQPIVTYDDHHDRSPKGALLCRYCYESLLDDDEWLPLQHSRQTFWLRFTWRLPSLPFLSSCCGSGNLDTLWYQVLGIVLGYLPRSGTFHLPTLCYERALHCQSLYYRSTKCCILLLESGSTPDNHGQGSTTRSSDQGLRALLETKGLSNFYNEFKALLLQTKEEPTTSSIIEDGDHDDKKWTMALDKAVATWEVNPHECTSLWEPVAERNRRQATFEHEDFDRRRGLEKYVHFVKLPLHIQERRARLLRQVAELESSDDWKFVTSEDVATMTTAASPTLRPEQSIVGLPAHPTDQWTK